MIRIAFYRGEADGFCGFSAEGHAGFADYGEDIVCSAISALCQTAYLGVQEVAGAKNDTHIGESGDMRLMLLDPAESVSWANAQIVLHTLRRGLDAIANEYPDHITISDMGR